MNFLKFRIFCALHRPVGRLQLGYHLLVIVHSFLVAFPLNVVNIEDSMSISLMFTKHIDLMLAVILMVETVLQLWSSSCIVYYRGLAGKLNYLSDHLIDKLVDSVGLVVYLSTFVMLSVYGYFFNCFLAVAHLSQLAQIYRITHRHIQVVSHTIRHKFGFLFSLFVFTLSVFLVCSHCLYLAEAGHNEKIGSIADASWLVFASIVTIGFGDIGPATTIGKTIIVTYIFTGLVSFSVMISLFGAELAGENGKCRSINILCLVPAAVLIQNVWKLHLSRKEELQAEHGESEKIVEKYVTAYLYKLKYLVSRKHFMVAQSDVNAFDENIVFYEYLANRLNYLEKTIYHNSHQLDSILKQMKDI